MYEFHGWVNIREGVKEAEDSDAKRQVALQKLRAEIDARTDGWSLIEIKSLNGADYFLLHGFRNHCQPWVLDLFEMAGSFAPGSYGVLYINDDEDKIYPNEMQTFLMRRGKVIRHRDEFFSPCIPVLEDDWE